MKRIVLIIAVFLLALSVNAQSIKYRRLLEPKGLSVMTTSLEVYPWGQQKIEYALQYETAPDDSKHQGYYLIIYFTSDVPSYYIPEGGLVLIRTSRGTDISLKDCGGQYFREYSTETNVYEDIGRSTAFVDMALNKTRYHAQGKYPISEDDLNALKDEGVIKIRIQTTGMLPVECNYKISSIMQNKTAQVITSLYRTLISNLDIYYGF